jgi:hypothetical protein
MNFTGEQATILTVGFENSETSVGSPPSGVDGDPQIGIGGMANPAGEPKGSRAIAGASKSQVFGNVRLMSVGK